MNGETVRSGTDVPGRASRPGGDTAPPRRGRTVALLAGVVTVLGVVTGVAALGLGGRHRPVPHAKVELTSAVITRCTLTDSQSFPGQTTFGAARPLPLQATGLITWLPKAGTVVREGQTLVRVDDHPVILLNGTLPQYRTLQAPAAHTTRTTDDAVVPSTAADKGAPDTPTASASALVATVDRSMRGADVRQLKRALTRLGYGRIGDGPDYTRATAEIVKRWQRNLGEDPTGTVRLGDVFYAAGPLRVVPGPDTSVGQPMSSTALQYTSRTMVVTATVDDTSTWAETGATLSVDAGQARSVTATVSSVTQADSTSSDGGKNMSIVAGVADQSALKSAGRAVTVTHVTARRTDVLCVPSTALVALAEGGYGLESETGAYLPVQAGMFAQGKVEVSGAGIHTGLRIQLPVED